MVGGGSCERGAAVVRRRARPVRWITAGVMISHLQGSYLSEAQADHLEAAQSTEVLHCIASAKLSIRLSFNITVIIGVLILSRRSCPLGNVDYLRLKKCSARTQHIKHQTSLHRTAKKVCQIRQAMQRI